MEGGGFLLTAVYSALLAGAGYQVCRLPGACHGTSGLGFIPSRHVMSLIMESQVVMKGAIHVGTTLLVG